MTELADLIGRLGLEDTALAAADYVELPGEEYVEELLDDEALAALAARAVVEAAMEESMDVEEEGEEEEEEEVPEPVVSLQSAREAARTLAAFVDAQEHLFVQLPPCPAGDPGMYLVQVRGLLDKACIAGLRDLQQTDIRTFFTAPTRTLAPAAVPERAMDTE
jgi:hypothetical protein